MNLTELQTVNAIGFPWWVLRKIGYPILCEADFAETFPNAKFGVYLGSTGAVTTDTGFRWGGTGSAKMLTAATINDGSEIKCNIEPVCRQGDLLAFECKWGHNFAQSSTRFHIGLESRSKTQIKQARFQWTAASGKWSYESATDVYTDLANVNGSGAPTCSIDSPVLSATAGTPFSWVRMVIDPYEQKYVSFEAPIYDASGRGYAYVYNMRDLPLPVNGSATRALYLPFTYVIAGNPAAAEPGYTTDWCLSVIPAETKKR